MRWKRKIGSKTVYIFEFVLCLQNSESFRLNKLTGRKEENRKSNNNEFKFPLSGNYLWTDRNRCNRMNERVNKRKELNISFGFKILVGIKIIRGMRKKFSLQKLPTDTAAVEVWIAVAVFNVLWNWIPADSCKLKFVNRNNNE